MNKVGCCVACILSLVVLNSFCMQSDSILVPLTLFERLLIQGGTAANDEIVGMLQVENPDNALQRIEHIYSIGETLGEFTGRGGDNLRWRLNLRDKYSKLSVADLKKEYAMNCHSCVTLLSDYIDEIKMIESARQQGFFNSPCFSKIKASIPIFFAENERAQYEDISSICCVIELLQEIRGKMCQGMIAFMAEDFSAYF